MMGVPDGCEEAVKEGPGGWAVWHDECAGCGATEGDEPLMALQCPNCGEPGCGICMPVGRGCPCPGCEETLASDADGGGGK